MRAFVLACFASAKVKTVTPKTFSPESSLLAHMQNSANLHKLLRNVQTFVKSSIILHYMYPCKYHRSSFMLATSAP